MKHFAIILIITSCVGLKEHKEMSQLLQGKYVIQHSIYNGDSITLDSVSGINHLYYVRYKYLIETSYGRKDKGLIDISLDPKAPHKDTFSGIIYFDDFDRKIEIYNSSKKLVIINPLLEK